MCKVMDESDEEDDDDDVDDGGQYPTYQKR